MRYVRFAVEGGAVRSGVIDGDEVALLDSDLDSLVRMSGGDVDAAGRRALRAAGGAGSRVALRDIRPLPPLEPVTVVAPGPRIDPSASRDLSAHREFYLKSSHTLQGARDPMPYRDAVGTLTYRAQLGLVMRPGTGRHVPSGSVLDGVLGAVLAAEVMSVDLLRVGWEGTMWHTRFGEGASFDGSCPLGPWLATGEDLGLGNVTLRDPWGEALVDLGVVAEELAYVSRWMALGPDLLVLVGSPHGPLLRLDGTEPVVEFAEDEPRVVAGGVITASGTGLGEIEATVGADAAVAGRA
jgi:2,4-diketo-3-deoxy-L-fuconate hydrolase